MTLGPRLPPLFCPWPIIKVKPQPFLFRTASLYPRSSVCCRPNVTVICWSCPWQPAPLPARPVQRHLYQLLHRFDETRTTISFHHARTTHRGQFFIKLQGSAKPDLSRIMRAPDQSASLLPELRAPFFCFTAVRAPHKSLAPKDKTVTSALPLRICYAKQHSIIPPSRFLTLCRPYCALKIDVRCFWQEDRLSHTTV